MKKLRGTAFHFDENAYAIEFGESAFPSEDYFGMTLLDYFAAKAMAAIILDPKAEDGQEYIAESAYAMAIQMLETRAKVEFEWNEKL